MRSQENDAALLSQRLLDMPGTIPRYWYRDLPARAGAAPSPSDRLPQRLCAGLARLDSRLPGVVLQAIAVV